MKITLMKKFWIVLPLILGFVLGILGWRRTPSRTAAPNHTLERSAQPGDVITVDEKQLQQISTYPIERRWITINRKATGRIAFNEDLLTPVFTPYAGRTAELRANKGDSVTAGQPLVVLESPDFVGAQNDLAAARSDVAKAEIGLNIARVGLERARRLHEEEAIAAKELQQAEADLARAQDEYTRAQATLASVRNRLSLFGKTAVEISDLEQHMDRDVVLRAPIAGTIVNRRIGPGEYVKPDSPDPLFLISDLSTLWVLADIYESDNAAVRLKMPVEISVGAYPDRVFPARISFISPIVDPSTRTIRVRCLLPNPAGLLKPDMFATVRIAAATQQQMPIVPAGSVVVDGNDSLVFIEESPGHFRRRKIQTGQEVEGGFVVDAGLQGGEIVASRGALLLNELGKSKQ